MTIWETILISWGVSLDAFAVALAIGLALPRLTWGSVFRATAMLTIPSMVVLLASQLIAAYWLPTGSGAQDWFAPLAFFWIGSTMIVGSHREPLTLSPVTNGWSLLTLGCAASVDVGIAGLAMGKDERMLTASILLLPTCTVLFVLGGLLLGSKLSHRTGRYAEITGGSLLIGMAQYGYFS